ncbi:PDZ and LIM domain protein Zasp [Copidosoma floridanum]|uniref:PDZ and LIM domain protein Zasp n=1 Tax=Copidosoma floridanum TaxID=29053 RepID=UPI0006C9A503|nr:PDZ and LIM domain protein Zasp [Copidosoma floridanum]XP_014210323.1 PDZ and LIM domain protein Zasp [Copidosoma floridanum]XP_014210324.1 PDZ and LIM domain protein Zasp [Copidosoma floridanum]
MSAPAIKSSMPGVGTPTASSGHTMMPMNMVSPKVVPPTDQSSGGMKPLPNTNLSYMTLQSPTQPLSLIQEHRAPYQPSFTNNIPIDQQQQMQQLQQQQVPLQQPQQLQPPTHQQQQQQQQQQQHKEPEQQSDPAKLVQNGMEQSKADKDNKQSSLISLPTNVGTVTSPGLTSSLAPAVSVHNVAPPTNVANIVPPLTQSTSSTSTPNPTAAAPAAQTTPTVTDKPAVEQTKPSASAVSGVASEGPKSLEAAKPGQATEVKSGTHASVSAAQNKADEKKSPGDSGLKEEAVSTAAATISQKVVQPPTTLQKSNDSTASKAETSAQKSPAKVQTTPTKATENSEKVSEAKDAKTPTSSRPAAKRRSRDPKEIKSISSTPSDGGGSRSRRNRVPTTPYQSPLPEYAAIIKTASKQTPKSGDDKLIVFYKNEFLAVRNTEGSFYVCQAMQNIYKSSKRIRIRWLSQEKNNGEIYSPDFYDFTDFDCILTNLNLNKVEKNKYQLTKYELLRTENILKRAIDVEAGLSEKPKVTEEHPDGLDISLYRDEDQLKKRKRKGSPGKPKAKRQRKKSDESEESDDESEEEDDESSSDDSEKQSPLSRKRSPTKRVASKATTTLSTPSTSKGPSRAERAMNRNKGVTATPSTSGIVTPVKKAVETKKAVEPKKAPPKVVPSTSGMNTPAQSRTKSRTAALTPQPSTSMQEAKSAVAGGRPKRTASSSSANSTPTAVASTTAVVAAAAAPIPSTSSAGEGPSSARKKPRGRV